MLLFYLQGHVRFHTAESCDSVLKAMLSKSDKVKVEKLTGKYFIIVLFNTTSFFFFVSIPKVYYLKRIYNLEKQLFSVLFSA